MSLTHRDYSGFLPFSTVPYSRLPSGWGYEMPLAMLTKCHWLAKSATLTAAIAYNYSDTTTTTSPPHPPHPPVTDTSVQSYVGTITGSCVISNAASGSPLMPIIPAARPAYAGIGGNTDGYASGLISSPGGGFLGFTDAGIDAYTDSLDPSSDYSIPYSNAVGGMFATWFNGMPLGDTLTPQGPVAWDQAANKWYTDLVVQLIGTIGGGEPIVDLQTIKGASDVAFNLVVDGLTTAIPLTNTYSLSTGETMVLSGTITLDFDTFWTP